MLFGPIMLFLSQFSDSLIFFELLYRGNIPKLGKREIKDEFVLSEAQFDQIETFFNYVYELRTTMKAMNKIENSQIIATKELIHGLRNEMGIATIVKNLIFFDET